MNQDVQKHIKITYTNWRGETSVRLLLSVKIWFGSTQWHKDEQWMLNALDVEKNEERDFALKDIKKWFIS